MVTLKIFPTEIWDLNFHNLTHIADKKVKSKRKESSTLIIQGKQLEIIWINIWSFWNKWTRTHYKETLLALEEMEISINQS